VILSTAAVSAGEAAMIPETIALQEGSLDHIVKPKERARAQKLRDANLAALRRKAAQFANDPFAQRLLAEAEFLGGDLAAAEAATNRLLVLEPASVEGLARKSIILSARASKTTAGQRAALAREARALAVKANRIDTSAGLPVVAFYQSFRAAGQAAPEVALHGLAAALEARPNNEEIRHLLVDELEARGRYREAIVLITLIANSPHDSPAREAARQQLARLQAAAIAQSRPAPAQVSSRQ
jgi:tetratricopeptide (TPR) repeat protein